MASEFWMVKRGNAYLADVNWTNERLCARRFMARIDALFHKQRLPRSRIVHVRVRPRSERLYMAERLRAWEPVVRAAESNTKTHEHAVPTHSWEKTPRPCYCDLCVAVRAMPEEHRP